MPIVPIEAEPEPFHPEDVETGQTEAQSPQIGSAAGSKDYSVGYGKPPKHTQFRKGQSGNPKGRPKFAKGLNTIIREEMLAKIPVRTRRGERYIPRAQAMVLKLLELAGKGDMRALRLLLDLYASAVPDTSAANDSADVVDFTDADQEILNLLKGRLLGDEQ